MIIISGRRVSPSCCEHTQQELRCAAPLPVKPGGKGHITSRASSKRTKKACWYGLRPSFVGSPRCDSLGGLKGTALSKSLECPTNIKGDLGWSCLGWGRGTRLDRMPWNCWISRFATGLPRRRSCLWRRRDGMWISPLGFVTRHRRLLSGTDGRLGGFQRVKISGTDRCAKCHASPRCQRSMKGAWHCPLASFRSGCVEVC
jgi:hypothetical protein